jgi:hypothetical protein
VREGRLRRRAHQLRRIWEKAHLTPARGTIPRRSETVRPAKQGDFNRRGGSTRPSQNDKGAPRRNLVNAVLALREAPVLRELFHYDEMLSAPLLVLRWPGSGPRRCRAGQGP